MADKKNKKKICTIGELKKQLKSIPDGWEVFARDGSNERIKDIKIMARPNEEQSLGCLFG